MPCGTPGCLWLSSCSSSSRPSCIQAYPIAVRRCLQISDEPFRTSCGSPMQAGHEQADYGQCDQRLTGVHSALILLAHPPVAREPAEGSFYHPSLRSNGEATRAGCTRDDFEIPVAHHVAPSRRAVARGSRCTIADRVDYGWSRRYVSASRLNSSTPVGRQASSKSKSGL